jgi:5-(carboxyamino)imidazole ribonucleotide synthase
VLVARGENGEVRCYPPVENVHKNHILHQTIVPAKIPAKVAKEAERIAVTVAEKLKLTGLLAVEMFLAKDNRILVNELAPRPHNSGHWTIDACATSQFEQTVRAVCGLPLGGTEALSKAVMTNLIGDDVNDWAEWLKKPNAKLHLYGKKEARSGRKMGHVTELKL